MPEQIEISINFAISPLQNHDSVVITFSNSISLRLLQFSAPNSGPFLEFSTRHTTSGRAGSGRVAQNFIVIRVYLLGIPVVNEVIFFYKNHYKIPLRGNQ